MVNSLTKDELKRLLSAVSERSNTDEPSAVYGGLTADRKRLMLLVGYWHGLRVSELINLRVKDIRGGYLSVRRLKKSLPTIHPFVSSTDPELDEAEGLNALAAKLKSNDKLFNITRFGVYKLMQRAGVRAGLPPHKCHPHVLKHSIAMTMKRMGKDVKQVQVYLGHVEGKNTLVYWEATMDEAAAGLGAFL